MKTFFDPHGTPEGLEACLQNMVNQKGVSALLVLCADDNGFSKERIDPILTGLQLPIAGGVFPALIHNGQIHNRGSLVVGLADILNIQTVENLSAPDADYEQILDSQMSDSSKVGTLILFVDGFATRLSSFVESMFNVFGLEFNYVGGGAGSLSMERKPCILTNSGMLEDAAVLAFLETKSGIGVCHGWQELGGPYQVTESIGNAIHSIEWQPALEFYRQVIEEKTGIRLNQDKFFDTAQHHPFGIARLEGEQVVRDPYAINAEGAIVCVGEIQEGAFVSILKADEQNLIQAAADSLNLALQVFPADSRAGTCFFVDCISRVIILGDNYYKEIEAVYSEDYPLIGICSIGEIANCRTEFLELYNKTSVMAVLEHR